jgi:hypothetical protein
MSKYDPLAAYLKQLRQREITLSFAEIEGVIGSPLPSSAHTYNAWWANENGATSHVQCSAWLLAGYKAHADLRIQEVRFTAADG